MPEFVWGVQARVCYEFRIFPSFMSKPPHRVQVNPLGEVDRY
jgi:hypothetical protein